MSYIGVPGSVICSTPESIGVSLGGGGSSEDKAGTGSGEVGGRQGLAARPCLGKLLPREICR